jgi:recombinational DNA repair protein RecR
VVVLFGKLKGASFKTAKSRIFSMLKRWTMNGTTVVRDQRNVVHGYGACSDCGCSGYKGNGQICDNCGHNYDRH